jgi:membrane protease YdiL (CAAX protease family)
MVRARGPNSAAPRIVAEQAIDNLRRMTSFSLGPPGEDSEAGGRRAEDAEVPATSGQGWAWMGLAVLGFLGGQVMSAVLLAAIAAANGHLRDLGQLSSRAVPPAWVVVGGLVGLWVGFAGAVLVASRRSGTGSVARDMGLSFRAVDFLLGPLVGFGSQLLLLPLIYLPLEHVVPHLSQRLQQPAKHLTGGFPGADLAVIAVLTVLVVPVVEETVFRGLFLRGSLRAFAGAGRVAGPALATVSTGVVFALAHFEALQFLGLAVFGVVLSVMAYRLRRLGPCITAHAAFNLVAIAFVAAVH